MYRRQSGIPIYRNARGSVSARFLSLMAFSAIVVAVITLGIVTLLVNIFERKQEAQNPFFRVVELTDTTFLLAAFPTVDTAGEALTIDHCGRMEFKQLTNPNPD